MTKVKAFILKHKKLFIILALLLIALFAVKLIFANKDDSEVLAKAETTEMKKKNFENSIRESGEAISENSTTIFAEKQLPVKEINVEVGDQVVKDQIIARLDDSSIRQQIAQKQAAIASTSSSSAAQIKNAQNRLSDANKNLEKGTNANIVAANNAVISAYDQWQSAEKAYDNYQRSLSLGYNDQIIQEDQVSKNADDGLNSAQLNLDQSIRKYSNLQNEIKNAEANLNSASARVDNLRNRQDNLTRQISDLRSQKEMQDSNLSMPSNQEMLGKLNSDLIEIRMKINSVDRTQAGSQDLLNSLQDRERQIQDQINEISRNSQNQNNSGKIDYTSQIASLENSLKEVSEDLTSAQADLSKYQAEVESGRKQLDPSKMEIEQQNLALNKSKTDKEANSEQKEKTKLTRKDQLEVYRQNAQDLKSAYESALRNLASAEEAAKDEISSLKNNLSIAKSSANTGIDSTDLKYLYEDLEKTVIRSPIDGTITNVNVEEGQVAGDFLAKVDTVDRIVVKTKVKEFDVNRLKVGLPAEITSDAVGKSKVFKGKVESINPTPISADPSNPAGGQKTNEVYYEVKLSLENDRENEIKPGMTLRVKYIFEKKKDVYVIPLAAIYEKNSKDFVLYLDKNAINKASTIKEMPVIIRDKNDYEAVVTSENDLSGIRVINSPDKYSAGMKVRLEDIKVDGD